MSRRSEWSANRDLAKGIQSVPDAATAQEVAIHDWHAEVSEYRLRHQGILPSLLAYIKGIGEAYR